MRPRLVLAAAMLLLAPATAGATTITYGPNQYGLTILQIAGGDADGVYTGTGVTENRYRITVAGDPLTGALPAQCAPDGDGYVCDLPPDRGHPLNGEVVFDLGASDDSLQFGSDHYAEAVDFGEGNDTLVMDGAHGIEDMIKGGPGNDTLTARNEWGYIQGGPGDDRIDGGRWIMGEEGNDQLALHSVFEVPASPVGGLRPMVEGGAGNDVLTGGDGADMLIGGDGGDMLDPGPGPDTVQAGDGDDLLRTVDGATDTVDCGPGLLDTLTGDRQDRSTGCEVGATPGIDPTTSLVPPLRPVVDITRPLLDVTIGTVARRRLAAGRPLKLLVGTNEPARITASLRDRRGAVGVSRLPVGGGVRPLELRASRHRRARVRKAKRLWVGVEATDPAANRSRRRVRARLR